MYRHILVPLDGSHLAEQVLPHIHNILRQAGGTQITLLRSVRPDYVPTFEFDMMYTDELLIHEKAARDYLDQIASTLLSAGYRVSIEVSYQPPADAILDFAQEHGVDLIAIATHGRSGINRWVFGSVTQKVIQASPVPVPVIRPQATTA